MFVISFCRCELCGYGASRGADINKHLRSKHRLETKEFSQFIKRPSSKSPPPGSASSRASSRGDYDEEENDEESLIDDDGESGYQVRMAQKFRYDRA